MVTLKQVASVNVPSAWSEFNPSATPVGRGAVFSPTYPIFVFDYQTGQIAVGYVVGSNGNSVYNQADANYLITDAIFFSPFGLNYAMGGGGICGYGTGCMGNGGAVCGPWWMVADLNNNAVSYYCHGFIPDNSVTAHFQGIAIDFENGNILFSFSGLTSHDFVVVAIPLSYLSSVISNQAPSSIMSIWLEAPASVSSPSIYRVPFTLFQGNFVQPFSSSEGVYLLVIPLSTLYSNMSSGMPSSSGSPTSLGAYYPVLPQVTSLGVPLAVVYYNGRSAVIKVGATYKGNFYVATVSPSFSVAKSNSFPINGSYFDATLSWWSGVFIVPGISNNTVYVNVYRDVYEYATTTGSYVAVTGQGYVIVAQQPLNSSTVTFVIYQVLLDRTYAFQNVNIAVAGQNVVATGRLVDLNTGSPVPNAVVYLLQLDSLESTFTGDGQVVATGTTDSNGNFSITYTAPSGVNPNNYYYAVYYHAEQ